MKNQIPKILLLVLFFYISTISVLAQTKSSDEDQERSVRFERLRSDVNESISSAHASGFSTAYSVGSGDDFFILNQIGNSSSQLSLSKNFEGQSNKNEGSFNVDESVKNLNLMLSGSVKSGKIVISVILPNGKPMKELIIDESADIQYNQSIKIAKEETKYFGKWTYSIESVKATGRYRLSINTN